MSTQPQNASCHKCDQSLSPDALYCPNCGTPKARDYSGDPLIGTRIADRYLVQERVGNGASGAIYRGEHVTLRRKVAIKVLHREISRDDLAIERFRREATTVGQIDNEHIVQILDFGRTDDGRLYMAMEYLEGEALTDVLERDGQLPVARAVDVLIQLGEALVEAHAIGYIHRDLRPRNLFLSRKRGRPNFLKLLDFGLAKLVEKGEAASTSLGMTFGDPHYMSPEQARGDSLDRRADIYSVGCIAYQMLVGRPPFVGEKVFDVLTAQVEKAPVPPRKLRPEIPVWLETAIMRCLEKSPEQRFSTVYRLVEALRQGQESGLEMPADVARRRESNPPASVSRAMEKFGSTALGYEPTNAEARALAEAQDEAAAAKLSRESAAPAPKSDDGGVGARTSLGLGVAHIETDAGGAPKVVVDDGPTEKNDAPPVRVADMPTRGLDESERPREDAAPQHVETEITPPPRSGRHSAAGRLGSSTALAHGEPVGSLGQGAVQDRVRDESSAVVMSDANAFDTGGRVRPVVAARPPSGPTASDSHDSYDDEDDLRVTTPRAPSQSGASSGGGFGKGKVKSAESSANISAAWYMDGDDDAGLSPKARRTLNKARGYGSDATEVLAGDTDDIYLPQQSRLKYVALAIGGAAVVIALAVILWPSGDSKTAANEGDVASESTDVPGASADTAALHAGTSDPAPPATAIDAPAPSGALPPAPPSPVDTPSAAKVAAPVVKDTSASSGRDTVKPKKERVASVDEKSLKAELDRMREAKAKAKAKGKDKSLSKTTGSAPVGDNKPPKSSGGDNSVGAPAGDKDDGGLLSLDDPLDGTKKPDTTTGTGTTTDTNAGAGDPKVESKKLSDQGRTALRSGDTITAIKLFRRALALNGANADAHIGRGEAAMRMGKPSAAINHFKKAAKYRSGSSRVYTLLGEAQKNAGQRKAAAASLRKALKINSGNKKAQRLLDQLTGVSELPKDPPVSELE